MQPSEATEAFADLDPLADRFAEKLGGRLCRHADLRSGGENRVSVDGPRCLGCTVRRNARLARYDTPIAAPDPRGDQAAVLLRRLLPRVVTGIERMDLTVG